MRLDAIAIGTNPPEDGDAKTEHQAIAEIEELEDELGVMPYEFEEDEE